MDLKNHADAGSCLRSISELIAGCESHPVEQQPPCVDTHPVGRRWYPVIDFDRCTHCMECIDFCLFGVYGVDDAERIFVEQPDQCRKGCPACSRVCPERAILFPMHKTPAIAGSEGGIAPLKLDLSQWFGGPSKNTDERRTADAERDAQLQRARDPEGARRDELDALLDSLDEFDS